VHEHSFEIAGQPHILSVIRLSICMLYL